MDPSDKRRTRIIDCLPWSMIWVICNECTLWWICGSAYTKQVHNNNRTRDPSRATHLAGFSFPLIHQTGSIWKFRGGNFYMRTRGNYKLYNKSTQKPREPNWKFSPSLDKWAQTRGNPEFRSGSYVGPYHYPLINTVEELDMECLFQGTRLLTPSSSLVPLILRIGLLSTAAAGHPPHVPFPAS